MTATGRAVSREARIAVAVAEQAIRIGRRVSRADAGRIRVACVETMTAWLLLPVLCHWRSHRADVQLDLSEFSSTEAMVQCLEDGSIDVAIGPRPTSTTARVSVFGTEEIVTVVTPGIVSPRWRGSTGGRVRRRAVCPLPSDQWHGCVGPPVRRRPQGLVQAGPARAVRARRLNWPRREWVCPSCRYRRWSFARRQLCGRCILWWSARSLRWSPRRPTIWCNSFSPTFTGAACRPGPVRTDQIETAATGCCPAMSDEMLDLLVELERAGWDSLCDSTGDDFHGGVMLPDAVMVLADGMVMDRETVVSAFSESPPWRRYEIADVRLIPPTPTTRSWCTPGPATERVTPRPSSAPCPASTTAPATAGNWRSIRRPDVPTTTSTRAGEHGRRCAYRSGQFVAVVAHPDECMAKTWAGFGRRGLLVVDC